MEHQLPCIVANTNVTGARFMVRRILTLALMAGSFTLAICSTMLGLGQDLRSVGGELKEAAK